MSDFGLLRRHADLPTAIVFLTIRLHTKNSKAQCMNGLILWYNIVEIFCTQLLDDRNAAKNLFLCNKVRFYELPKRWKLRHKNKKKNNNLKYFVLDYMFNFYIDSRHCDIQVNINVYRKTNSQRIAKLSYYKPWNKRNIYEFKGRF